MELDYQLGEDIKEKLIPRAIDWFTGEALAYEELEEDDEAEFEDDDDIFREFCLGRHHFEVRCGNARAKRAALERAMAPFLSHDLRRVREWAKHELSENESEAKFDDKRDEVWERL